MGLPDVKIAASWHEDHAVGSALEAHFAQHLDESKHIPGLLALNLNAFGSWQAAWFFGALHVENWY